MSINEESSINNTETEALTETQKADTIDAVDIPEEKKSEDSEDQKDDDAVDKTEESTPQPSPPPPSLADPPTQETTAAESGPTTQLSAPPPSLADPPSQEDTTDPEVQEISEDEVQQSIENMAAAYSQSKIEAAREAQGPPAGNVNNMANDLMYNIIQETLSGGDPSQEPKQKIIADDLYPAPPEQDQLTAFIEDTLGALADDIEMGERTYIPHDEAYFWMTYFFLQFCGFRIFLANIDDSVERGEDLKYTANIIAELVDTVANNAEYLHADSDIPEHIAKNIIWQILNSSKMLCRYSDKGVSVCQVEEILEEILDKVVVTKPSRTSFDKKDVKMVGRQPSEETALIEPQICEEFGGIFQVAENFIDKIMSKSLNLVQRRTRKDIPEEESSRFPIKPPSYVYPRIEEFTVKVGTRFLRNVIHDWKTSHFLEDWACSIKFLLGQSDSCSDYYIYESKFGLPTPLYPVPQATCSLLFNIEVSRVKPPVCFVNLSYKIEGSGYQHDPRDYPPQESWLLNVIDAKLRVFSRVTF